MSSSDDRAERERLHKSYIECKKISAREVAKAQAQAETYREWYDKLETPDGQKELYKIAARRRNDSKPVIAPKFINDKHGNLLTENGDICNRFKEYFEELLNESFPRTAVNEEIPPIELDVENFTKDEIETALQQMKNGRAVGPGNIPNELYKKCGEIGVEFLYIVRERCQTRLDKVSRFHFIRTRETHVNAVTIEE